MLRKFLSSYQHSHDDGRAEREPKTWDSCEVVEVASSMVVEVESRGQAGGRLAESVHAVKQTQP